MCCPSSPYLRSTTSQHDQHVLRNSALPPWRASVGLEERVFQGLQLDARCRLASQIRACWRAGQGKAGDAEGCRAVVGHRRSWDNVGRYGRVGAGWVRRRDCLFGGKATAIRSILVAFNEPRAGPARLRRLSAAESCNETRHYTWVGWSAQLQALLNAGNKSLHEDQDHEY